MPKNSHPLREEQLVNLTTFPEVSERMREILGGLSAGLAHLNNFPILKHVSLQQGYAVNMVYTPYPLTVEHLCSPLHQHSLHFFPLQND